MHFGDVLVSGDEMPENSNHYPWAETMHLPIMVLTPNEALNFMFVRRSMPINLAALKSGRVSEGPGAL